jgi:transposase
MRKIREIMRLKNECRWSHLMIARSVLVSESTVSECLKRAREAGLSWPLPTDLTDGQIEAKLYPPFIGKLDEERKGKLDWAEIHKDLKRNKHVTLRVLWFEYN